MIRNFLEKEVAELGVRRKANRLMTSPGEIAKHTGLSVRTVREYLLEMAKRRANGVAVIRVGKAEVVVRFARETLK